MNNLSVSLTKLGRPEDALAAIEEAVTIRRELAAARPDAYRPDLALSLNNLAARLADPGRLEDALAASQEGRCDPKVYAVFIAGTVGLPA